MKFFLLPVLLFCSFTILGQSFTNGSVYNYSIGDTIVTMTTVDDQNPPQPPTYKYRLFTGKTFSAAQDTVFYSGFEVQQIQPACINCQGSTVSSNFSFFVTNLTQTINIPVSTSTCQTEMHSSGPGYCALTSYTSENVRNPGGCFEAPYYRLILIEGIGSFMTTVTYNSGNGAVETKEELVKAHKVGKSCGVVGSIPNSIVERQKENVKIFPNPSNGIITIETPNYFELQVYNIQGQLLFSGEIQIGKHTLTLPVAKGLYHVKLISENSVSSRKIVVN
jgi:hypothetical protein